MNSSEYKTVSPLYWRLNFAIEEAVNQRREDGVVDEDDTESDPPGLAYRNKSSPHLTIIP